MRNKSIYLLLACVCGTIAAILASQWLKAQANNQGPGSTTEIFVAAVAIDLGEKITPEKIQLEQWPSDKIPQGATGDLTSLEGKYAKTRFYVGEAVMPVKLMDENWSTVPKGYKVVAMKASEVSIANLIQPGDHVDVLAYFQKSELIPRSELKTVLSGVRVYALDGDTERKLGEDRPKSLRTIELLIHEEDAEAWTYANELGNVRLSLGSDVDYSDDGGSNEAGQDFLAWLDEHRRHQEEMMAAMKAKSEPPPVSIPDEIPLPQQKVEEEEEEEEEGFSMIKMVEGRMLEYWIVPGKLPVLRGEAGVASPDTFAAPKIQSNNAPITKARVEDEYGYLNGSESPFFIGSDDSSISTSGN